MFAVKSRCADAGCHPLCVHVPGGAKCVCPDRASFIQGSDKICDAGKSNLAESFTELCPVSRYWCELRKDVRKFW